MGHAVYFLHRDPYYAVAERQERAIPLRRDDDPASRAGRNAPELAQEARLW